MYQFRGGLSWIWFLADSGPWSFVKCFFWERNFRFAEVSSFLGRWPVGLANSGPVDLEFHKRSDLAFFGQLGHFA